MDRHRTKDELGKESTAVNVVTQKYAMWCATAAPLLRLDFVGFMDYKEEWEGRALLVTTRQCNERTRKN